jgi:hypothetical protein
MPEDDRFRSMLPEIEPAYRLSQARGVSKRRSNWIRAPPRIRQSLGPQSPNLISSLAFGHLALDMHGTSNGRASLFSHGLQGYRYLSQSLLYRGGQVLCMGNGLS